MKTRIILTALIFTFLSLALGKVARSDRHTPFYLIIHTDRSEASWVQSLESKFSGLGWISAGDLNQAGWMLKSPGKHQGFGKFWIDPGASPSENSIQIKRAISLLERKYKSTHNTIVLVSDANSAPFINYFINAPGKHRFELQSSSFQSVSSKIEARERKLDDWILTSSKEYSKNRYPMKKLKGNAFNSRAVPPAPMSAKIGISSSPMRAMAESFAADSQFLGLSVGGAKDIGNFRENIRSGYLPKPTDLTYEGIFYDYFFETQPSGNCSQLFCPTYTKAISQDPFSLNQEYYLAVGLQSGMKVSDFQRKRLNLVIVLDISGSMDSPFNQYHYNQAGTRIPLDPSDRDDEQDRVRTKLEIAARSITHLMDHLKPEDRFSLVLFDNQAQIAKPFRLVGKTDMEAIKSHILNLRARGGTNLSAGMRLGTQLFEGLETSSRSDENRIIFLTDAMPNQGELSPSGLFGMVRDNATRKIHSTLIGIGVDFQTELVEKITRVRGANYYSVHSAKEFQRRMNDEFDYMVTPLIFDLKLSIKSQGYQIEKVYGEPEASGSNAELLKVHTLFPSKQENGEVKGGLILIKLSPQPGMKDIQLMVSYEDAQGRVEGSSVDIQFQKKGKSYEGSAIRKGILLTKYVDLLKHWILDERSHPQNKIAYAPHIDREIGILPPPPVKSYGLGPWEHESMKLNISEFYAGLFRDFARFFQKEMKVLGDKDLQQEMDILNSLGSTNS